MLRLAHLLLASASLAGDVCIEDCAYPQDGICDDGGPGSQYSACDYGADCTDCGPRALPPPPPPPPPPATALVLSGMCPELAAFE
eukprot:6324320-Prymnesium_polylepis.1